MLGCSGSAASPKTWIDVPFVAQQEDGCGSASISMVLRYWMQHGAPVAAADADAGRIQRLLYSEQDRGIFAGDMVRYFRAKGFRTFVIHASRADLDAHLAKGRPLIVCLGKTGSGALHYVVVCGSSGDGVLVNDPARRKLLLLGRASFEKAWSGTDHWTLLAVPGPATKR